MKIVDFIGKLILIAFITFLIVIVGWVLTIIALLSNAWYLMPFIIALCLFLVILTLFKQYGWNKRPTGKKVFYGITGLVLVGALVVAIPDIHDRTIAKVGAEVDLYEYQPFNKGTKAVKLGEPSTLMLEDKLPILDGATALYPMYAAFAQAVYPEKEYDVYEGEVMSNKTDVAYEKLIRGEVDIIFAAGPSKMQEADAKRTGKELKLTPIGKEAFVFFVNSKNPVKGLTLDEIKKIYSGKIGNWKEVHGKNKEIRAFQRPENSGSQTALQNLMGVTPIMDPPTEDVISFMGGIIDEVSAYKNYNNAIGYTFRYYSTQMVKNNKIRLLEINGVEPTVETIRSGAYPITGELYAITAGSDNPHVEAFIEWILSEQGQKIIEKTGYVPITE